MRNPEFGLVDLTTAKNINAIEERMVRCVICGDTFPHHLRSELSEADGDASSQLHDKWNLTHHRSV